MDSTLPAPLSRVSSLLVVAIAVVAGVAAPVGGPYLEPLVAPMVAVLVFLSFRGLAGVATGLRSGAAVVGLSLVVSYLLVPVLGIGVATHLLSGEARLGLAVVLAAPTTAGSAIVWTRLSGGDAQLSTLASVASIALAPIATPVVLAGIAGRTAAVPVDAILLELAAIVALAAVLVRLVPAGAVSDETADRLSMAVILALIYTSVATLEAGAVDGAVLGAVLLASLVILALGAAASVGLGVSLGLARPELLALAFAGNLKNLGIALLVAVAVGSAVAVTAVVAYYVLQQLLGALVADGLSDAPTRPAVPGRSSE